MKGNSLKYIFSKRFFSTIDRWGWGLIILVFLSISASFIANDKPFYCQYEGVNYFPLLGVDIANKHGLTYKELDLDRAIYPLIPFTAHELSPYDPGLSKPWTSYSYKQRPFRHYLGTDRNGRDVAAGIINGLRIALLIGLGAMFISTIIGLFWGILSGYFGNVRLKVSYILAGGLSLLILGVAYLNYLFFMYITVDLIWSISQIVCALMVVVILAWIIFELDKKWGKPQLSVPLDTIFNQLITVFSAVPVLLFLLLVLTIVKRPSIYVIILILGAFGWIGIARYARAETLKIRDLPFIQTLENFGLKKRTILLKHILPNVLSPIMTRISFGVAGAILAEAFLSFIGLGLGLQEVTWGSMLNQARNYYTAWWLVLFPGIALFFVLWFFNKLGQKINKWIDPYYK